MTWKDLLEQGVVDRHQTSREEIADVRSAVEAEPPRCGHSAIVRRQPLWTGL